VFAIAIDVTLLTLDVCEYFVGVYSEGAVVSDRKHIVPFDLVDYHHLNDFGRIVYDLLQ